ncbi:hypothetical protein [Sinorhizobium psoraleae]|uniref:hypothetical protein n=1 Tax=Sinorhizobium psoraleae TaxID=520838 RepID=UPI0022AEE527|nr:hypothetical protein [Sinorhizobium psoraleae]
MVAQPVVERLRQHPLRLAGSAAVAANLAQPERCRRLVDVGEHLAEERFMRFGRDAETGLRHQIAERLRRSKLMPASRENGLDLGMHHLERRMIADQMMPQHQSSQRSLPGSRAITKRISGARPRSMR